MRIAMVGAGYVGLVTGACLADFGHSVQCVDSNPAKIEALKAGRIPIYEPGLDELVARNAAEGRISFSTDLADIVPNVAAVFIAVGTPSRRGDGHADLSFVFEVARRVAPLLTPGTVVITKSTVPVGTGDEVERIIREARPGLDVSVVSNPEFLREGAAIQDFKKPDRIVVGAEGEHARAALSEIYRPLYLNQAPILFTSRRTAELIKYAANAFLATKITFINEMADLAESTGADVQDVARGIGLDNRIGPKFLHAGPGFGGSCFPKDLSALIKTGQDHGIPLRIAETVAAVNDQRKRAMGRKIIAACGGDVRDRTIALLGVTFKPNTDDIRDAPSISIAAALRDAGARVRAFDPICSGDEAFSDVEFFSSAYEAAQGADALAIVTEWDMFRALDLERIRDAMRTPVLVDLRNIYAAVDVVAKGFRYVSIGRGSEAAMVRQQPLTAMAAE